VVEASSLFRQGKGEASTGSARTAWIERHGRLWDSRFAELDKVVEELKQKESLDG
jgi:hypothetical protein